MPQFSLGFSSLLKIRIQVLLCPNDGSLFRLLPSPKEIVLSKSLIRGSALVCVDIKSHAHPDPFLEFFCGRIYLFPPPFSLLFYEYPSASVLSMLFFAFFPTGQLSLTSSAPHPCSVWLQKRREQLVSKTLLCLFSLMFVYVTNRISVSPPWLVLRPHPSEDFDLSFPNGIV